MAQSVLAYPNYQVKYDNTYLNTNAGVLVTNTINAYVDSDLNPVNLTLGASSNVVLQAYGGIDAVINPYEKVKLFNYLPGLPYADPYEFLRMEHYEDSNLEASIIQAPSNALWVSGGDVASTTYVSTTIMTADAGTQKLSLYGDYISFTFDNDVNFNSNVNITGDLHVLSNAAFYIDVSVSSNLDVNGVITGFSNLHVLGDTTLEQDLTINNTLEVAGNTTLHSQLTVDGAITGQSTLSISGNATLASNLEVDIDITCHRNVAVAGNMFSSTLNLYKNMNPASNAESQSQVAYGMFINAVDQLEVIKFEKFVDSNTSNVTTTQKRVAVWGIDESLRNKQQDSNSLSNYNVLHEYNGITTTTYMGSNAVGYTYGYTDNIPGYGGGGADSAELTALSNYVLGAIKTSSSNVYIDNTSNFCVGTFQASSNARLTVNGAIAATSYCNLILDNPNWTNATKYVPSLSNFNWLRAQVVSLSNSSGTGMGAFQTGSNANSLVIMGSNIGLGLTSPQSKLHVSGTVMADAFAFSNASGYLLLTESNNRLGINNANPSYTLHVTGSISATQDIIAFSDSNFKTNVSPITEALSKVSQIGGYTFNKTDPADTRRYAGVLAQEIEQVLPEVVYTDDNTRLSVAYGNLTALLIEAVKELKTRVEVLEARA